MNLRRLLHIIVLLAGVITAGTAGYVAIEGWPVFDALYMTVTTVSSVSYGEIHPLSTTGRVFTLGLIVVGLGTVLYGLSAITAFWVEGDLSHMWERRKMARRIADLHGHIIVCGGGDTGRHILRELLETRTAFVCVERDPGQEPALQKLGEDVTYIIGDATDADVLRAAGIGRARGLISSMPSDKDNLFAILTARELNPGLRIVSRVLADDTRSRLLRAGADAVVFNKNIGALRLASELLRPHVVGVLDAMLRETTAVRVEEILVGAGAAGLALGGLKLQERTGVVVFAFRERDTGRYGFNPAPDRVLHEGDVLIACADPDQLTAARAVARDG
ncbi:MAG: potassium channel family protein [Candidatus Rokubacteria bacterium]|nr:potassium channel family protein [Candidatus Rokubacteria bacterium]MBI3826432.1 potassium channel family protein [Candidatus Rokubacteria bacterium]